MADSIEMQNRGEFNHWDGDEDKQQETSMDDGENDKFEDAEENLLYSRKENTKWEERKPILLTPKTNLDKRTTLKKYFNYNVYDDPVSRGFLDHVTFEQDPLDNEKVDVKYKGIEIATIDTEKGALQKNEERMRSSGFLQAYRNISKYRVTTFSAQVQENTGDTNTAVNQMIEQNVKRKFALEINRLERSDEPGDQAELIELREDFRRLEAGKKIQTLVFSPKLFSCRLD